MFGTKSHAAFCNRQRSNGAPSLASSARGRRDRQDQRANDTCHVRGNPAKTAVTARRTRSSECSMSSSLSSFFAQPCHTGR